jgi:hypothetical protein
MFGTGEYTEALEFSMYTGSISDLYEDGVIVDIVPYLDYMPNFKKAIETIPGFRRGVYDDDGHILAVKGYSEVAELVWGGLMYRYDILEQVTGGNIRFPSGNAEPTTIDDWDYMLPLFKKYFEDSGKTDYAPLIIPYNGSFYYGELGSGFGFNVDYYVEDGKVKHGLLDGGLYNYIVKLREWYRQGYIYKDFASRVNDRFYLPNPGLTYGGSAGVWYGNAGQLGGYMSRPEYGMIFDVRALSTPLDTAHGITKDMILERGVPHYDGAGGDKGWGITTKCKNIPKLLAVLDDMYSDEGGLMRAYGLRKEQIPASDYTYAAAGLEDGIYWFDDDGNFIYNPLTTKGGGTIDLLAFYGVRLPGYNRNSFEINNVVEIQTTAHKTWTKYDGGSKRKPPTALTYPPEEETVLANNTVTITDYVNSMLPKYIMGTEPFNEAVWEQFKKQLVAYGIEDCIKIRQAAVDRYLAR